MQNHYFEPMDRDPRYCGHMSNPSTTGSSEFGIISISTECGYPPSEHPEHPIDSMAHKALGRPR